MRIYNKETIKDFEGNVFYVNEIIKGSDTYIFFTQMCSIELPNFSAQTAVNNKVKRFSDAIATFLDEKAQENSYDSIINASLRAALPNSPFYAEGVIYGEWMDSVWAYCYQELDKIQNGLRTEPTLEEFLVELPPLNLQG